MQQAIVLAIFVGFLNVGLNLTVSEAARPTETLTRWVPGHTSVVLLTLAFIIGCSSLTAMFFFYRLEGGLARGLILMGTVSIVVGSVTGMILSGKSVDRIEIALLCILAVLFLFRWMKTMPLFGDWLSGYM